MSLLLIVGGSVPTQPGPENAVAPNYERYDGLESFPHVPSTPLGDYPAGPAPGQRETRKGGVGGIEGAVGTVGGMPLPVAEPMHRSQMGYTTASTFSTQANFGPVGMAPGFGGSSMGTYAQNNPGAPAPITDIFAGA